MKKLLLASAVAALSVTAAQAAPQVYGKAFLSVDHMEKGRTQLNSNASRIGLKGAEPLNAETDIVYKLEYGIDIDEGETFVDDSNNTSRDRQPSAQFYARDTYLGLSNKTLGTVVAGRLTAIDDNINYVSVTSGLFDNNFGGAKWNGPRANNAVAYISPVRNDMQFYGMYVMDESKIRDSKNPNVNMDTLDRDGYGVAVKYEPKGQPFRGGASYIGAGKANVVRLSGAYDVNPLITAGALYQMQDDGVKGSKKENVLAVSGQYKTGTPWLAYAEAHFIKNAGNAQNAENTQFVVGGKYAFNQAATGHVYVGHAKKEVANSKTDGFGLGAGLEYKF